MTDDIVERLRSFAELGDIGSVAMEDAADEIVNLRAALNWLRGWRTKDHESIDCTIQHALGGAETCDVCHPHGSEALPASAGAGETKPRHICYAAMPDVGFHPSECAACEQGLPLPAEAAHRISEAHDRAVELLRELVDIEGPQPGHVMWARKVWAFLGIPEPSATSENPDAVYDPVASDGHAGARARQIDDVADDSFREAAEAHAQVRRALVGLWRIVETKDRATADDLRNIARSVITELMNTEVRCDDDPPPPAPAPAPEDKA